MKESKFQAQLVKKLRDKFPGCLILKNDSSYVQGIPDLMILYNDRWGSLEVKASKNSPLRPNQLYYLDLMRKMSFASTIYPENEDEVLDGLQHAFRSRGEARIS